MAQVVYPLSRRQSRGAAYVALREHLAEARKQAGLTQTQLAERLGRNQSFVAKYEGGERFLDAIELIAVASILRVDLNSVSGLILPSLEGP